MWEYLVDNAVWSGGGLVIGYLLGRMERQIQDVKRKVEEREHDDDT